MSFDKTMQGALDTFKLAKDFKKGKDILPFTYADFFAEKNNLLESFGLSWKQRIGCMLISLVLSFFFFFRVLMSLISLPTAPQAFSWNFSMLSIFILCFLGFFGGFKTLFKNTFSREMLPYSVGCIVSTFLCFLGKKLHFLMRLSLVPIEVVLFALFMYAYIKKKFKSGVRGIGSTLSIF